MSEKSLSERVEALENDFEIARKGRNEIRASIKSIEERIKVLESQSDSDVQ